MQVVSYLYLYVVPAILILAWYWRRHVRLERQSVEVLTAAAEAGLAEPPTLHPEIDPVACIGCGACVAACPEQDSHPVLGMIGKKARLVGPSDCIGHGACKAACPANAITLVFGTETRGVDIPVVKPNFETDMPGIFIAGELGGMGLIRNAIEQGRQAVGSVREILQVGHGHAFDLLIVGAGPAGFSATLAAKEHRMRSVTIEQDSLGGTVAHYPRRKLVMTQPAELPLVGKVRFKDVQKETLVDFWRDIAAKTGIAIHYGERVVSITPAGDGYLVQSDRNSYETRVVLLAIGRRGTPRQLGVPGEDLAKVVYRLIDPEQYRGQRVLVVGGGDSALEAAAAVAEQHDTAVTLSYRSAAFGRAKLRNRQNVDSLVNDGRIEVMFNSNVAEIGAHSVILEVGGVNREIPNDAVIISAGGILPNTFLKEVGIRVETKWGTA